MKKLKRDLVHLCSVSVCSLTLTSCSLQEQPVAPAILEDGFAEAEFHEWPTHGGTYNEQRFSQLNQINTDSVRRLGLAWYHEFDTRRGQSATPLMVGGVIYTTTAWSKVAALDAKSGSLLWLYDPKVPGKFGFNVCCDVINRGAAYADGKIFFGTIDGQLVALNAKTGELIWSAVTVDQTKRYSITGAPRVANGKVYIGNGGADFGVRGYVSAYDAASGKLIWRFYTVPGDPGNPPEGAASDAILESLARPTWAGDKYWEHGGGGTAYDAIVYDEELHQLYIGVGNGSPWNHRIRSEGTGDNLFLVSIVALDPDTGDYLWHYQINPGETWDFTATQPIMLADLKIDNIERKVLMQAPKNGFFYVLDRNNGSLISAENFVPVNWASHIDPESGRPAEIEGSRYKDAPFLALSGANGGHNWHPMSYSPKTGLVYIPAQELPMLYVEDEKFRFKKIGLNGGVDMESADFPDTPEEIAAAMAMQKGYLLAWDPIRQREEWRAEHKAPPNGGTLATAGGLVFQGTADGKFKAFDAQNGRELWGFDSQTVILAGPISYSIDGEQYVAVMAGQGAGLGLFLPAFDGPRVFPNGRLLVFKLGGKASLPAADRTNTRSLVTEAAPAKGDVAIGSELYGNYCALCHGAATLSAGVLPDLKRTPFLSSAEAWRRVLLDGVLESQGMINFSAELDPEQAESIRSYVLDAARQAAAE